jgi:glycopeptide antibiotics resistance protein
MGYKFLLMNSEGDLCVKKIMRFILWGTFLVYCFFIIIILFLSSRGYWSNMTLIEYMKRFSNFVPLKTIWGYVQGITKHTMNLDIPIKNIFGNLLMFLPMGLYLPCLFKEFRSFGHLFLGILILLISVEVLQMLLRRGSFDIDDLILNITGAMIGFVIWKNRFIQKLSYKMYLIQ